MIFSCFFNVRLWALVLIAVPALFCFQQRLNPLDPANPNARQTFGVAINFTSDTLMHSLRFSVTSPQFASGEHQLFLAAWRINFNNDSIVDICDTTESATYTWFIPQGWQRRLAISATVVATDGSRGFDSLTIDTAWAVFKPGNCALPDSLIYAIAIDSAGHKWIATRSSGLIEHYGNNWISQRPENSGYVSTGETKSISIDRFNNKWIGKAPAIATPDLGGGLWQLSAQSGLGGWRTWDNRNSLLPDNYVFAVGVDHADRVWCLTNKGTRFVSILENGFVLSEHLFDSANGMPGNFCTAVVFDSANVAWIGTAGRGSLVKIINDSIAAIIHQPDDTISSYQNRINCILLDQQNGDIWVGSGMGLQRLAADHWQQSFTKTNSGLSNNQVLCLAQCAGGDLWVGTTSGLCRFNRSSQWTVFDTANSLLPSTYIRALAREKNHTLWVGTTAGLVKHYYLDE